MALYVRAMAPAEAPTLPLRVSASCAESLSSTSLDSATTTASPTSSDYSSSPQAAPRVTLLGREHLFAQAPAAKASEEELGPFACRPRRVRTAPPVFPAIQAPAFKVKNTFINGFADDEDELPMGRYLTSPGRLLKNGADDEVADDEGPAADVEPLATRQPAKSLGSVGHGLGLCRPCGWFWRPQGCTNGADCRHCHLCLSSDVRNRKKKALKAKKAAVRGGA